jgi:hypothetical protein
MSERFRGPREIHGVASAQGYRDAQAAWITAFLARYPVPSYSPHPAAGAPRLGPLVEWGTWKIACAECGNWPAYDTEWQLACCLECGAIYDTLAVDGDVAAIEAALELRDLAERNWP